MDNITRDGNTAIATFMGCVVTQAYPPNEAYKQDGLLFTYPEGQSPWIYKNMSSASLKYHCSLDWLAPCIVKFLNISIDTTDEKVLTELNQCKTILKNITIDMPARDVWNILTASIYWYNGRTN